MNGFGERLGEESERRVLEKEIENRGFSACLS